MTENLQKALNGQITAELWSANLYLSMSFYLEKEGFSGMARWMRKQSAEETGHACAIAEYMAKREAEAKVTRSMWFHRVGAVPPKSLNMPWNTRDMFPD